MKLSRSIFASGLLFLAMVIISPASIAQELTKETALLIIDVQDFYFPGGDAELIEPGAASENIAELLSFFRAHNLPVIHVRHNYEPGGTIHENVRPTEGEKVFSKDHANSFRDTDLLEYIVENSITSLVISGMQTHMCVEATTRAAADLGLSCMVIADGCATRDLRYGDKVIRAEDVHYSTLSTLRGTYAEIYTTGEFLEKYGNDPK